jgi:hypothetical protein
VRKLSYFSLETLSNLSVCIIREIQNNPVLGAEADPLKEIQALKMKLAEARQQIQNIKRQRQEAPPAAVQSATSGSE